MSDDTGSEKVDLLEDDKDDGNPEEGADQDDRQMFIPMDFDNTDSDEEDLLVNPLSSSNPPNNASTAASNSTAGDVSDIGVNGWLTKPVGMRRQLSASDIVFRSGNTVNEEGIYNRPLDSRYDQDMNYNARSKTKSPPRWYTTWTDPETYRKFLPQRSEEESKRGGDDGMQEVLNGVYRRCRGSVLSFLDSHPVNGNNNWAVILIILLMVTIFLNSTISTLSDGSASTVRSESQTLSAVGGRYSPEFGEQSPQVKNRNRGIHISQDQFTSYLEATKLPTDTQEHEADLLQLRSGLLPLWDHLADITEPFSTEIEEVSYFFHVFRTGGTSLSLIMARCFGLVVAHRPKLDKNGFQPMQTNDVDVYSHSGGGRFADIDLRDPLSIQRAKGTNVLEKSDVLVSSQILSVSEILIEPPRYRGRMFTTLRHPVDRLLGIWRHVNLGKEESEKVPLLTFAKSNVFDENGIVRYLTNTLKQELSRNHLLLAMDILRQKALVGMLDDYEESLRRYETYFGWVAPDANERSYQKTCIGQSMADNKKYQDPAETDEQNKLLADSDGYKILMERNSLDLELYEYAKMLYREQGNLF